MRPRSAQRIAQTSSSSGEEKKRSLGSAAIGQADQDRNLVQRHDENEAELQFGGEMMQQMVATSFNAEGRRLEHPRGAVQALESDDEKQDCRWKRIVEGQCVVTSLGGVFG